MGAQYLHHLHFQHHFRFGVVLHRDQVLGQANHIRRIANHQQVQLLVDEGILGLEHGLDHVLRLLDVGVLQVEGTDHQVLVFANLRRGGRVDHQRVVIEHLAGQLVRLEQQGDRVFDQHIAHRNADADIRSDFLVEDEIQAATLGQSIEDLAQAGLAKLQADRLCVARLQLGRRNDLAEALGLDLASRFARLQHFGVFCQHLVEQVQRQLGLALAIGLDCPADLCTMPPGASNRLKPGLGARIFRMHRQNPLEGLLRRGGSAGCQVGIGTGQQLEHYLFTLLDQAGAQGVVAWIGACSLAHAIDAFLDAAILDQPPPFARKRFPTTTGQGEQDEYREGPEACADSLCRCLEFIVHGPVPV